MKRLFKLIRVLCMNNLLQAQTQAMLYRIKSGLDTRKNGERYLVKCLGRHDLDQRMAAD
jgi:hypothetical protein